MADRPFGLAIGGVDIGDARRVRTAPRPIIARIGPELADLRAVPSGIEHGRRGLVGKELRRGLQLLQQARLHRAEQAARPTQSASVERSSALPWRA
jgi:hypothetical protein